MNTISLANTEATSSILAIYTPYILDTSFTFETEVPSLKDFEKRIVTYQENWPWLVYEVDGIVAGYAYATRHRERAAYQWCVESSVYIKDTHQQRGIANALYKTLFEIMKHQGFINVYAGITLPNDKSVAFHKRFGFNRFADYENVGYKFGKWNTVSWWHYQLNEYVENPTAPTKFSEIEISFLNKVLAQP